MNALALGAIAQGRVVDRQLAVGHLDIIVPIRDCWKKGVQREWLVTGGEWRVPENCHENVTSEVPQATSKNKRGV
jgi:hypothetical protein